MSFFRKCFVVAACFAFLTSCSAKELDAATCDQTCNARVQWYWASQQTLARQWFGWIAGHDPHQVCVKAHESATAGGYSAYDGTGNWGAYQDDRQTWDAAARVAGRPDLVGVRPDLAAWWDQEQVNWALYMERGDLPWGSRCLT